MTSGESALRGVMGMRMKWRLWTTTRGLESTMAKKLAPVHPGEILREEYMRPLGLSMNRLALDLRVPVTRISEIVRGRRGITSDTALRLARYFNTTPQFWMNLQIHYDLEVAKDRELARIKRDVRPIAASSARSAPGA